MTDEPFLLTVAGISMSFAGFAGLMNALRRGDTWQAMHLYQLRIIVAYALASLFAALTAIPASTLLGERAAIASLGAAMTLVSIALGLWNMFGDIRLGRERQVPTLIRATFTALTLFGQFLFALAALTGVLQVYELALIFLLTIPAGTFAFVVAHIDR